MSLNTAHLNGEVFLDKGEKILLCSDGVTLVWCGQKSAVFQGTKTGILYLTTNRLIFISKPGLNKMISFSFPFESLSEVEIEQPSFSANYIKGKVRAQRDGNWTGEAKFKITFKKGGAIEFGEAMKRVARLAFCVVKQTPPPYVALPAVYGLHSQETDSAEVGRSVYSYPNKSLMNNDIPPPAYKSLLTKEEK
ncbi:unnamed protein product [Psylliodes chrysocephalus]|uniref:GRAM domain-containing protein n=1 Tax=Psylliodes chrysocephalus TaxID=3402493 RepID=A0A9P0G5I1_9CUCU|nr:unnamed protein product [Psylliodes chrysocephala]